MPSFRKEHPLHRLVADQLETFAPDGVQLLRDGACKGLQHLPLFIGKEKSWKTQMCKADALLIAGGKVRVIVEVEESGFSPTKICGKFFQAALATHFIHENVDCHIVPYASEVLFVEVVDGLKCRGRGVSKEPQIHMIAEAIRKRLPAIGGITEYRHYFVNGPADVAGAIKVAEETAQIVAGFLDRDH